MWVWATSVSAQGSFLVDLGEYEVLRLGPLALPFSTSQDTHHSCPQALPAALENLANNTIYCL